MNGYVFVVDSPLYAKAQASGAFTIHGVTPGRYELAAWHEAASTISGTNSKKTLVRNLCARRVSAVDPCPGPPLITTK